MESSCALRLVIRGPDHLLCGKYRLTEGIFTRCLLIGILLLANVAEIGVRMATTIFSSLPGMAEQIFGFFASETVSLLELRDSRFS